MTQLLAQDASPFTNPIIGPITPGKGGVEFLQVFIPNLIVLGFIVGALVFLFILIIGAIQWMASGGDKAAVEAARGKITNAIIGIIILFALFAILGIVGRFLGIEALQLPFKLNLEPLIPKNSF